MEELKATGAYSFGSTQRLTAEEEASYSSYPDRTDEELVIVLHKDRFSALYVQTDLTKHHFSAGEKLDELLSDLRERQQSPLKSLL
jgi:hypothetical protein